MKKERVIEMTATTAFARRTFEAITKHHGFRVIDGFMSPQRNVLRITSGATTDRVLVRLLVVYVGLTGAWAAHPKAVLRVVGQHDARDLVLDSFKVFRQVGVEQPINRVGVYVLLGASHKRLSGELAVGNTHYPVSLPPSV